MLFFLYFIYSTFALHFLKLHSCTVLRIILFQSCRSNAALMTSYVFLEKGQISWDTRHKYCPMSTEHTILCLGDNIDGMAFLLSSSRSFRYSWFYSVWRYCTFRAFWLPTWYSFNYSKYFDKCFDFQSTWTTFPMQFSKKRSNLPYNDPM